MSILIGEVEFEGPYFDFHNLNRQPGIYAVLSTENDDEVELLELDEADDVKEHSHKQRQFWQENVGGVLSIAVYYTPGLLVKERKAIKDTLLAEYEPDLCRQRNQFNPPHNIINIQPA